MEKDHGPWHSKVTKEGIPLQWVGNLPPQIAPSTQRWLCKVAPWNSKAAAKLLFGVVPTADEPIHCSPKGSSRSVDWIVSTPVVSPVIADWSQHWTPMLHLP